MSPDPPGSAEEGAVLAERVTRLRARPASSNGAKAGFQPDRAPIHTSDASAKATTPTARLSSPAVDCVNMRASRIINERAQRANATWRLARRAKPHPTNTAGSSIPAKALGFTHVEKTRQEGSTGLIWPYSMTPRAATTTQPETNAARTATGPPLRPETATAVKKAIR